MTPKKGLRADAERNRRTLLEVAQSVFAAEGLAVPIDEIAKRAGLGVGTLYRHFPTKEALFQAIVLGRMEGMVEDARSLATARDPGEAFFAFLRRLTEEGAAKKDLMEALSSAGPEFGRVMRRVKSELRDAMAVLLGRAQASGVVRKDVDAGEVLLLVMATYAAVARLPPPQDRMRERLFTVVCDGLKAKRK